MTIYIDRCDTLKLKTGQLVKAWLQADEVPGVEIPGVWGKKPLVAKFLVDIDYIQNVDSEGIITVQISQP
jgi:hypothetical protein